MPNATSEGPFVYCDASALVKLVVPERESEGLRNVLAGSGVLTSELSLVEVSRALHRRGLGSFAWQQTRELIERVDLISLSPAVLLQAGSYGAPHLRALDAIHLASAEQVLPSIDRFVSYDRQQLRAAEARGLAVHAPS